MPSYPLSIPSALKPVTVELSKQFAVSRNVSPFTYEAQTYQHAGERWMLMLDFAPVAADDAGPAVLFYLELQGALGTFAFDVSNYDKSQSGDGSINFRLVAGQNPGWKVVENIYYFEKLNCEEDL